jgi:hypothetical protein
MSEKQIFASASIGPRTATPESTAPQHALRLAGTMDAGSLALEHGVETPPAVVAPGKSRRGRRILATALTTLEAAGVTPGSMRDNLRFGLDLVTTDPYIQAIEASNQRAKSAARPEVRR